MRAIVYTGPLELELQDTEPPIPKESEVLIDVKAVGICGSELEGFANQSPFRVPPLIMGHEFAGITADQRRVTVNPVISCGSCDMCLLGHRNLCRSRAIVGIHRPGAFAEKICVPEANTYPIPADLSYESAALAEPIANAIHAFRLAASQIRNPQRVGVIGSGMLGLATALVACQHGVPDLSIADIADHRQATARAAGFSDVGRSLDGEFDVIFDAVGSRDTRRDSVARTRPGGVSVWIGLHGPEAGFDGLDLIRNEKRVLGTFVYDDNDFRAAIEFVGGMNTDWITTIPLDEGAQAFLRLLDGPGSAVKTILIP